MAKLDYHALLTHRRDGQQRSYDVDKVLLYGVGVGLGLDPHDPQQLQYLVDDAPKVLPSFAAVAAFDVAFLLELGIDWSKLIHASQRLRLHRPLPPSAEIVTNARVTAAFDKPAINATLLVSETEVLCKGEPLATLESVALARDFRVPGTPEGSSPPLPAPPDRAPDATVLTPTSPQVALIYRLLGGRSLIHCDPAVARAQGFDGPIMHGLSTWGHACHAIVRGACGGDPTRLNAFAANFSAPAYPGETLKTEIWMDGGAVRFRTLATERGAVVLGNGCAEVAG